MHWSRAARWLRGPFQVAIENASTSVSTAGRAFRRRIKLLRMKPDPRMLRFGSYQTPRYKLGRWVNCLLRGRVKMTGTSDGQIPWPTTTLPNGLHALVLYRDLAKAVPHDAHPAMRYWFEATVHSIGRWRKVLKVTDTGRDCFRSIYPIWTRTLTQTG